MICAIPKGYPCPGVPLAAFMACVQLGLAMVHDVFAERAPETAGAATPDAAPKGDA
ncbi:hypothetical protein [uncultured Albimonas sp.]|mgnify:CR=1 FL=1|uniref:hypothetical protein n=1 Tax=uncultured Albimonas sp. TaxID=1331701 RepID=UPI0030EBF81F|tara:strand:- start:2625 stop:2792 length:168 start_codon:yes stop_codon:yes gene_type:complete